MTLNQNTLSAKLYLTFYSSLPDNLCPYFWKLVLAYILAIPYFLFVYPCKKVKTLGSLAKWILVALLSILIMAGLALQIYNHYHLLRCLLGCYSYDSKAATGAAIFDLAVLTMTVIVVSIIVVIERKPKLIAIEFVKAKYGKYCPKIDWK